MSHKLGGPRTRWICKHCGAVHHYEPRGCGRRNCGHTLMLKRTPEEPEEIVDLKTEKRTTVIGD